MNKTKCDICGYEHNDVVREMLDGIKRCKVCRHKLMYGRYIQSDAEAFSTKFTEGYKRWLEEWSES